MKINLGIWFCAGGLAAFGVARVGPGCVAAEPIVYGTASNAPLVLGGQPPSIGTNAPLSALKLQAALLKDLAQEHSGRAADAAVSNQVERVKWETALANELQDRSARLLKVMDQVNDQRVGSGRPPATAGTSSASDANGVIDEEIEFLEKLEDKLLRLDQELSSALEQTRIYTVQLATNNVPENFQKIALLEDENQRYVRGLQKEQFDLDLRRLEYRAFRRLLRR